MDVGDDQLVDDRLAAGGHASLDGRLDVADRAADDHQVLAGTDCAGNQEFDRGGLEHFILGLVAEADARKLQRNRWTWDLA